MKRKIGKGICIVLICILLVGLLAYIVGGLQTPRAVTGFRAGLANTSEWILRGVRGFFKSNNDYGGYQELCVIPETENGYVPQGYCYCEALNMYVISYYHGDAASVLSLADVQSGVHIKTLRLQNADGSDFTGHAGGIADDAQYLYICEDNTVFRVLLSKISALADGDVLILSEKMLTDVKCSYLNCDDEYLYAGEFYTYYGDDRYGTDATHHMQVSMRETHFSRCNVYRLSDIDKAFAVTPVAPGIPVMAFTTPNLVQGFARLPDGGIALSTSYGRNTDSHLLYFSDATKGDADYTVIFGETEVPVYCLTEEKQTKILRLPPLLEGIDQKDGEITGIFESGAQKYSDGKFPLNSVCRFE